MGNYPNFITENMTLILLPFLANEKFNIPPKAYSLGSTSLARPFALQNKKKKKRHLRMVADPENPNA